MPVYSLNMFLSQNLREGTEVQWGLKISEVQQWSPITARALAPKQHRFGPIVITIFWLLGGPCERCLVSLNPGFTTQETPPQSAITGPLHGRLGLNGSERLDAPLNPRGGPCRSQKGTILWGKRKLAMHHPSHL